MLAHVVDSIVAPEQAWAVAGKLVHDREVAELLDGTLLSLASGVGNSFTRADGESIADVLVLGEVEAQVHGVAPAVARCSSAAPQCTKRARSGSEPGCTTEVELALGITLQSWMQMAYKKRTVRATARAGGRMLL